MFTVNLSQKPYFHSTPKFFRSRCVPREEVCAIARAAALLDASVPRPRAGALVGAGHPLPAGAPPRLRVPRQTLGRRRQQREALAHRLRIPRQARQRVSAEPQPARFVLQTRRHRLRISRQARRRRRRRQGATAGLCRRRKLRRHRRRMIKDDILRFGFRLG
jgi:hypothetical protein